MASPKTPSPPAVERALSILELLSESNNGLSLLELRQRLGLPKSSVHCLLVALERRGYLHRNERTGRYRFGLRLFTLANTALSGLELREMAAPYLRNLMRRTGLTVHLAILEGDEVVLADKVQPLVGPRLATWIGKRMDVHCTSVGKVLAAYLPEARLRRIVLDRGLPRHNENTVISPRKFEADLAQVRRQGYAISDEEDEIGLRCLGAPVFGPGGDVLAAVSLAGHIGCIGPNNERLLARLLRETAAEIAKRLAFRGNETNGKGVQQAGLKPQARARAG